MKRTRASYLSPVRTRTRLRGRMEYALLLIGGVLVAKYALDLSWGRGGSSWGRGGCGVSGKRGVGNMNAQAFLTGTKRRRAS